MKPKIQKKHGKPPPVELAQVEVGQIVTLKRNPQYLTPVQMERLKASIQRDGFVAPILVRPIAGDRLEIVSGNHRFMAAKELGMAKVPCVVSRMSERAMKRLAVNLNTIHGEPPAELLAPFLAELDNKTLAEIHLEEECLKELCDFDANLKARLDELKIPDSIDRESPQHANQVCECPKCGRKHFKPEV